MIAARDECTRNSGEHMGQMGFFDVQNRLRKVDKVGDPLEKLNRIIPWEEFRGTLKKALRSKEKKNAVGRPAYDEMLIFKTLVLQSLYNLSDEAVEFYVEDRLTFMRFLGLGTEGKVPDAKTIWWYRNELAQGGWGEKLFEKFNQYLEQAGVKAEKGQIIDASFADVPRQRNHRDENEAIKRGEIPKSWEKEVSKMRQKDVEARWAKKNEITHYGYKNHIGIDRKHKIIRKFKVTAASVHDSQVFEEILDKRNSGKGVWADSAYRSRELEELLKRKGYRSHVCEKGKRSQPLTPEQIKTNHIKSKIRVRVEHVFGHMATAMNTKAYLRAVGIIRARMKIATRNLVYNLCRYETLMRLGAAH